MKKILRPCAAGCVRPRVRLPLAALLFAVAVGTAHAAQSPTEAFEPCVLSPEKMGNPNPWVVKDAKPPDKQYRWEGYNDKLVDTCLGPHRYRIPANHFYDQMGPDFQGGVVLLMQWPDLQAPPPGKRSDAERAHTLIRSSLAYVDRVSVGPLLEQFAAPRTIFSYRKLSQRDPQPPRFGLVPYYVNAEKFEARKKEQERVDGYESIDFRLTNEEDWYLDRDAEGRLATLIKCGSHLQPDGYAIRDDRVEWVGPRGTSCTHEFVIPEHMLYVRINYSRVLLKDWKRYEAQVRKLMTQYRVR